MVSKANTGESGALNVGDYGNFVLNDGRVIVNATGTSDYGFFAGETTTTIIKDGAFIVNGGTKAGMKAYAIQLKRGLLRVNATGTNDVKTYGILMIKITIGDRNSETGSVNYLSYPTLEVVENSTNSYGVADPDPWHENPESPYGEFNYYTGRVEISSNTRAIECNGINWLGPKVGYGGPNKEESTLSGFSENHPYIFVTTTGRNVWTRGQLGEYGILVHSGRAQNMTRIGDSTSDTASFEGRTDVSESLTALDQMIKDLFCPMEFGSYGILKDIVVSGGNLDLMIVTNHGIVVNGPFLETVTMTGNYTYQNGDAYSEKPFEITFTVATEVDAETDYFGCKMICNNDVINTNSITVPSCADVYVAPGKTLTIRGLRINSSESSFLRYYGPGILRSAKENGGNSGSAFEIGMGATFILNDGCVDLSSTGTTAYGMYGKNNSHLIINDGAMVVSGGKKAGIRANEIVLKRGLLRVNATGADDAETYGILMNSLSVGIENDYTHRPTLEVVASSENSVGITNPNPGSSGNFIYYCGFVEVTATTQAFDCFSENVNDGIVYSGDIKATASTSGASLDDKYVLINHDKSVLTKTTDYDYLFTLNSDGKEDSIYLTPTSLTLPFEGRTSENLTLTDLDQFVKDFFYPVLNGGPYGTVKDIEITGGNGQVVGTTNGFAVNGKFNGPATISGKYTYFDGTEYLDIPFEIDVVVSGGPDLTYEAHGDTLTATYGTFGSYDLTIVAPTENLAYDGNAKVATLEAGYNVYMFPNAVIKYFKGADEVDTCIEQGEYTAKVSFGGESAEVSFVVSASNQNNNHGFCLGWISFIVSAFVFLWLVMNLCLRLYKYKGFRIFGILLAFAGLACAIVIVAIHFCAISIVSTIVAAIALLGFVLSWSLSKEMKK